VRPVGLSLVKEVDFDFTFLSQQIDLIMMSLKNDSSPERITPNTRDDDLQLFMKLAGGIKFTI
jgi:hypothetical protein